MAYNNKIIERVAFANFDLPIGYSNTTQTIATGAYIPAGAIVTGIRLHSNAAFVGAATLADNTFIPFVGPISLSQSIGTADRKVTEAIVQTLARSMAVINANGFLVQTGGVLNIEFGTSNVASTGVTADADIYVEYLYCSDRDTA